MSASNFYLYLVLLLITFVLPTIAIWMDDVEWHRFMKH